MCKHSMHIVHAGGSGVTIRSVNRELTREYFSDPPAAAGQPKAQLRRVFSC